jgi:peptidoglycan/xylan/chitin deacetylase (PgdA/CDA1 family)
MNGPPSSNLERSSRRHFLHLSSIAIAGAAGCMNEDEPSTPTGETPRPTGTLTRAGEGPRTETTETTRSIPTLRTKYDSREKFSSLGTRFDDFEDTSRWKEIQGSVVPDASKAFIGSQSLKLSSDSYQGVITERRLDSPLDVSERDLSFALRSTTPMEISFLVYLYDNADNWVVLELRNVRYRPPDVGWFRTSPGVFDVSDTTPDLSQVNRIKIEVGSGSEDGVQAHVDDMRLHPKPETGYVVLSWDDGKRSYYDHAAPVHDRYDFPAVLTQPPHPEDAKYDLFMSVEKLRERQAAGDEVVAHGSVDNPFSEIAASELESILRRNKEWLINNEFTGADFIVYPGNNFDKTALSVIRKYHYMGGMNQSGNVNTTGVYGFDPLVLPRTIGQDLDIAKRAVTLAAEHRQCSILNFHDFSSKNTMSADEYKNLLAHIDRTVGVEPITFSELWKMRTMGIRTSAGRYRGVTLQNSFS